MRITAFPRYLYMKYLYYKIRHIRGATRLKIWLTYLSEVGLDRYDGEPESVFEKEDWDNLIILDACRYDIYKGVTGREVEKRVTLGSTSSEYFGKTYSKGDYSDIVLVSANGFCSDEMLEEHAGRSDVFFEKYELLKTDWDEDSKVISGESMVRDTLNAEKLFPDKRKIIHFMQPHDPFVNFDYMEDVPKDSNIKNEYDLAHLGRLSKEEVVKAYKDNLRYVLEYVEELVEKMDGKTVVTADHGELLGEQGMYRHPKGLDAKALREVPWDVAEEEERFN
jgi:hypothetical protein